MYVCAYVSKKGRTKGAQSPKQRFFARAHKAPFSAQACAQRFVTRSEGPNRCAGAVGCEGVCGGSRPSMPYLRATYARAYAQLCADTLRVPTMGSRCVFPCVPNVCAHCVFPLCVPKACAHCVFPLCVPNMCAPSVCSH